METVRLVMVEALPRPDTPAFAKYGGATINVYTTELSEHAAVELATREVAEAGWQLQAVDETYLLTRAELPEATPEGVAYFEQALLDGVVVVIHTYPATPQEGDLVH
ncbi:hypothetical protein [Pseudoxanthomonas dokdonensis]|uniref:Uncharacterized protein n=1 Tax=Pseudoxanthomonas dokdonensis TaxID=344882 RepID=A0A0R0CCX3_9GAMM|nr:hypothetical protein [Pseudoxanthomonas dokdonensis]KRG67548.1 hypothetical protein ABB29_15410 [Pseudoxanthomonas dokdonensis]